MRIVAIADTHGQHRALTDEQHYRRMPEGDVLVVAGDLCAMDGTKADILDMVDWMGGLDYKWKLLIGGNHDLPLDRPYKADLWRAMRAAGIYYCEHEGMEIEGVTLFLTPYTPRLRGIPWAFGYDPQVRTNKWDDVPDWTDVLVTHGPAYEILDKTIYGIHAGCPQMLRMIDRVRPKVHLFGHIHEGCGRRWVEGTEHVNCAVVDERYRLVNQPQTIEL